MDLAVDNEFLFPLVISRLHEASLEVSQAGLHCSVLNIMVVCKATRL